MKKIKFILGFILILGLGCNKKTTPTEGSKYDFSPKESTYINGTPSTASFTIEFDGVDFKLINTSLSNVRPSTFDLEVDGPKVITGHSKLFEIELINALGQVYFTEIVTAPAKLRSNFPDEQNTTVLHEERPLDRIVISPSFPLSEIEEPAGISISEVTLKGTKIVPLSLKDTTRNLIKLDSIIHKIKKK